jgi:hypothetical protein
MDSSDIALSNARSKSILLSRFVGEAYGVGVSMSDIKHPVLHLLALERTGWRRWIFGRWVYSSEPFRRDIQRQLAERDFQAPTKDGQRFYPDSDKREQP